MWLLLATLGCRGTDQDPRIDELEAEVAALRAELETLRGSALTTADLDGYATEAWVDDNFVAEDSLTDGSLATTQWVEGQGYATETWVGDQSYATETWVGDQGYATEATVTARGYATEAYVTALDYAPKSFVTGQGYATEAWVAGQGYATQTWVGSQSYATQSYVTAQGYATRDWVTTQGFATTDAIDGFATEDWVDANYATPADLAAALPAGDIATEDYVTAQGYATEAYVGAQGFATEDYVTARGFATEDFVTAQGYATQSWVGANYATPADIAAALPAGDIATEGWVASAYVGQGQIGAGLTWDNGDVVVDTAVIEQIAHDPTALADALDDRYILGTGGTGTNLAIGTSTLTCSGSEDVGTLSYDNGQFYGCTPDGWIALASVRDGSSPGSAGDSCLQILGDVPSAPSGEYWLLGSTTGAFQTWCDMTTDGGGWTLVTNNNAGDTEPSGCVPRFGSHESFLCGTDTVATQDFVVPAWDLEFHEMVWAAYTGTFAVSSYQYMTWDTPQAIPHSAAAWYLRPDASNVTLPEHSAKPKIYCNYNNNRPEAVGHGNALQGAYGTGIVALFTMSSDLTNYRMSFTDYGGSSGYQSQGLDDFQDGNGCSDSWNPTADRGKSSFVMVR